MAKNEQVVSYTAEEIDELIARGEDRTDWERVRNMTDEEAEAAIDHEEEGEFDWDAAYVGTPHTKKQITLRLDTDIIDMVQGEGAGLPDADEPGPAQLRRSTA